MKDIYQRKMKAKWSDLIIISSDWENANLNMSEMTAALEGSPCCLREERDTSLLDETRAVSDSHSLQRGAPAHPHHRTRVVLACLPFPKYSTHFPHICGYLLWWKCPVSVSSPGNILCYLSTLSSDFFSSGIPSLALRRESPLPCTHYFVVVVVYKSTMG